MCKTSKVFTLGIGILLGSVGGGALVKKLWLEKHHKQKKELASVAHGQDFLYILLKLKQNGVQLSEYFMENNLQTMAVLGMNRVGRYLLNELVKEKTVTTVYGVDTDNLSSVHEKLVVYRLGEDNLPLADCLVICLLNDIDEKVATAQKKFSGKVVMLEEVLKWLMDKHDMPRQGQSAVN